LGSALKWIERGILNEAKKVFLRVLFEFAVIRLRFDGGMEGKLAEWNDVGYEGVPVVCRFVEGSFEGFREL
jgi:hypothetical protein